MTIMLKPGIYELVPVETDEDDVPSVALDPNAVYNEDEEESFIGLEAPLDSNGPAGIAPLEGYADHLMITIGTGLLDANTYIDGGSVRTPYGALTVAEHYLLKPAAAMSRNAHPSIQYAMNWLTFELTGEQPLEVEGSVIRIGGMEIDPMSLGSVEIVHHALDDVETTWGEVLVKGRVHDAVATAHVARVGDPLNDILCEMPRDRDDGVLVILTFTSEQIDRIEWLGTQAADAFARRMRGIEAEGGRQMVVAPAIGE